ncbi:LysM domain-containing protein, partial [Myxococcota bacterium]
LDLQGGFSIMPGMRLEIPTVNYYRVEAGQTWEELAQKLLGARHRATVLSMANGSYPWLSPQEDSQILVPYNLRLVVRRSDTLVTIAFEFMGRKEKAWVLAHYNQFKGEALSPGDVVLVPLVDLKLSHRGKEIAATALGTRAEEMTGTLREAQLQVDKELAALIADVKGARYVDAVRRGNRFLAVKTLGKRTLATVHRQLLEAYVALDALGLAVHSCGEWRRLAPHVRLDPMLLSPKLLGACERVSPPAKKP